MSGARAFFDAIARRYDRHYALSGPVSRERMNAVLALVRGKRRALVLGLGSGRELPALLDAGHVVEAIDVSPEMIALHDRRARRASVVLGDFYDPLPFEAASFDAVLALHGTLAHPPRPGAHAELARELARVLVPQGVFVAEVPSAEGLALLRDAHAEGVHVEVTGPTTFVHHDAICGASIEGVALTAEGWRDAFTPSLEVSVERLGAAELVLVGRRPRP